MEIHKDLPVIAFKSYDVWLKWLEQNYTQNTGIWLKLAKKGTGVTTINYVEAREVAIIYGWIYGLANYYYTTINVLYQTIYLKRGFYYSF